MTHQDLDQLSTSLVSGGTSGSAGTAQNVCALPVAIAPPVIVDNPNATGEPQGADIKVGETHADSSHP